MRHWSELIIKLDLEKTNIREPFCNNIMVLSIKTSSVFWSDRNEWEVFDYTNHPSYYSNRNKQSLVYIWTLSIEDVVYYGRTLQELSNFVYKINYNLRGRRGIIHMHDLSIGFQILRNIFELENDLSMEVRKPIKCDITGTTITFRCSKMLSDMKLRDIPEKYDIKVIKPEVNFDYYKLRHSGTELSTEEFKYCEYDCLVIYEYMKIMIRDYKSLKNMPRTYRELFGEELKNFIKETGNSSSEGNWRKKTCKKLNEVGGLKLGLECFNTEYDYINPYYKGMSVKGLTSVNIQSMYLHMLLTEKFPRGNFSDIFPTTLEDLDTDNYAYIMKVKIKGLISKDGKGYIPTNKVISKYHRESEAVMSRDNKVISAETLFVVINEIDYEIINYIYNYESIELIKLYSCRKYFFCQDKINIYNGKMNTVDIDMVKFIIKIYSEQLVLEEELRHINFDNEEGIGGFLKLCKNYKRVESELNLHNRLPMQEYIINKVSYEHGEWTERELSDGEIKDEVNGRRDDGTLRIPTQWGIWVTAYVRLNIIKNITLQLGSDIVYCDASTIKYIGEHNNFIYNYNLICEVKIKVICEITGCDYKDLEGLGWIMHECDYSEFKALCNSKYAFRDKKYNLLGLEMPGIEKDRSVMRLEDNIDNFNKEAVLPFCFPGELTKFYNDNQVPMIIADYQGNEMYITDKYGVIVYSTGNPELDI